MMQQSHSTAGQSVKRPDPKSQQPPQPPHRYDGIAKVTGTAKYAAEFREPFNKADLLYAYMVQATIANGTVARMHTSVAERCSGVVKILTPFNAPQLNMVGQPKPPAKRNLTLLQDTNVSYNGQPIAVVVAKSLVEAQQAANLLRIHYREEPARLDFMGRLDRAYPPEQPGLEPAQQNSAALDVAAAAAASLDQVYVTPVQVHNPMEPHATIAWWEGQKLNVYDSTQYISGVQMSLARVFSLPQQNVHVRDPYVGGGFGCKGSAWSHVALCALASKVTGKPVKLVLERMQMFGPVGHRPSTVNHIRLAADASGKLTLVEQHVKENASVLEDFVEHSEPPARKLYASQKIVTSVSMVDVNWGVGTFMRAPGESSGTAVLEIAMDELAEKLKMDPIQLRLVNYAERDPIDDKPWSSKHLRECYEQASQRFNWSRRHPEPRQISDGNCWIGYGMASATYPANRSNAEALAHALPNGRVLVASGTQDLGTGMYTVMAQVAAANLGLDPLQIDVKLGDSTLPKAPVSGGSQSTASVGPAVDAACTELKLGIIGVALSDPHSPVYGSEASDVYVKIGRVFLQSDPAKGKDIVALIARNGGKPIEAKGAAQPSEAESAMSSRSFGAVFAEVAVDKTTHMVKVRRVVGTYDIGTLVNNATGINQLHGGIVWGISFALQEHGVHDPVYGRIVNENLAEYHVPVNADLGEIDVTTLNIPDTKFNPLGARGIGEIGITGVAGAVANAIYNATGKRIREYPITPDKIMLA